MSTRAAMVTINTTKMTADQYAQLGDDPLGVRLELVNGEIAVSPSPGSRHALVVSRRFSLLSRHIDAHELGLMLLDIDTPIDTHNVRRPDLLFDSRERTPQLRGDRLDSLPDPAIEGVSPSSGEIDSRDKLDPYAAAAGLRRYWVVDPDKQTLDAYTIDGKTYRRTSGGAGEATITPEPFPDVSIDLATLWRRID